MVTMFTCIFVGKEMRLALWKNSRMWEGSHQRWSLQLRLSRYFVTVVNLHLLRWSSVLCVGNGSTADVKLLVLHSGRSLHPGIVRNAYDLHAYHRHCSNISAPLSSYYMCMYNLYVLLLPTFTIMSRVHGRPTTRYAVHVYVYALYGWARRAHVRVWARSMDWIKLMHGVHVVFKAIALLHWTVTAKNKVRLGIRALGSAVLQCNAWQQCR